GTPLAFILSQDQTLRRFQLSPEGVQVLSTGILVHDRSVSQLSPVIRPGRPPGASQRPEPASVSVTLQLLRSTEHLRGCWQHRSLPAGSTIRSLRVYRDGLIRRRPKESLRALILPARPFLYALVR